MQRDKALAQIKGSLDGLLTGALNTEGIAKAFIYSIATDQFQDADWTKVDLNAVKNLDEVRAVIREWETANNYDLDRKMEMYSELYKVTKRQFKL